ncbi:MAG: serine/threonine protein kinase, partial [Myxococcales bacterium]|nr:serine/threonine protein kinase [Myxococcales bacterium]
MTSGTNPGDDDGTGEPSRWDSFVRAMSGEDLVGQILGGRYELQERIGSGGMGVVYLARHRTLTDRRFAVKVLHRALADDPECRVRFLREAKAAASIEDPHVVWVTDFGPASEAEEGPLYLVMEHLEGEDLSRTLAREGAMSWERAAAVVTQICQALHAAHARHVIHRDIKPQNCFRVTRRETSDFIKVLD